MLHDGQIEIAQRAARFNVVRCGRRFGKTTLGIVVAYSGNPIDPKGLRHGYDCGWFAPTYKLLNEAWRAACAALKPLSVRQDAQLHRIELRNGAAMDFWTLESEDAGRGRKYGTVVIDEAAMSRNLEPAWNDAIRPTLSDHIGSGWILSTPKGHNFFWQLHNRAERDKEWATHHAPTAANPYIEQSEIEAARLSLPERSFRQEYLAEFIADGAGVFRGIDSAPECQWLDGAELGWQSYVIGVDWGRHNDFTVAIVMSQDGRLVHVDRFTDIGYSVQVGRLAALWERFGKPPILAESNSMGGPLVEQLQRNGINVKPFATTSASKAEAIESLVLAFERGRISLPKDERIDVVRSELIAFDQERLPSGTIRYGAPPGQHDDTVMALAIAWHGVGSCTPIEIRTAPPRRDYQTAAGAW